MARLPYREKKSEQKYTVLFSIAVTEEQVEELAAEMVRTGIKSRSELIRRILEDYFAQEIDG
jgi:metal-responsive CopG/Arc/MetJ family transcriptional regulator